MAEEASTSQLDDWVLPDFSLDIPAGQTLAVVGHTGAGKSSLVKLIMRFYEFQGGRLLIDGRDIRALDLAAVPAPDRPGAAGAVSVLGHRGRKYSLWPARRERCRKLPTPRASLATAAGSTICRPGCRPMSASAARGFRSGQRQLVALARVLLQDPSILLLDEATASIDPFTERRFRRAWTW